MVTYEELHNLYKKYLYIEDEDRIDIVLAVAKNISLGNLPLWIFLVGPSGDLKTEQIRAIEKSDEVFVLNNLSSKALVNGYKDKKEHPDLAPRLDKKLVVIPDFASILSLPTNERAEIYAQLRDLYDGYAGRASGLGGYSKYSDLKVDLIACSTPKIDTHMLINQNLGTRELIFRTRGNNNKDLLMQKCIENESLLEKIRETLNKFTRMFLNSIIIKEIEIDKKTLQRLKELAVYTSKMRVVGDFDYYRNELSSEIYPEEPSRLIMQFKKLFICLKSLSPNYPDSKALRIIKRVANDSSFPMRVKIYNFLKKNKEKIYNTQELMDKFKVGHALIKRECYVLYALNLIDKFDEEYNSGTMTNWKFKQSVEELLEEEKKDKDSYL
jgi:hypothetical protein